MKTKEYTFGVFYQHSASVWRSNESIVALQVFLLFSITRAADLFKDRIIYKENASYFHEYLVKLNTVK